MTQPSTSKKWIIGISGASGMPYARRLLEFLAAQNIETHLVISEAGLRVLKEEEGLSATTPKDLVNALSIRNEDKNKIISYNSKDIGASIASGSFKVEGMVVVPASMGTVAAIANGMASNLLQRAAEVTLKESRRLILVPRETPLSEIHCENLLKLTRAGAKIVPAMPGFYHKPKSLDELIDMMVMKILDVMGIENEIVKRWSK